MPPAAAKALPAVPAVISVQPSTGTDLTAFALVTSRACRAGTNLIGRITGPGLGVLGINVVPNTVASLFARTAARGYFMPSNNTLRALLDQLPDPPVLKGTYQLHVLCVGPVSPVVLDQFSGSLVFDGHHAYAAKQPDVPAASLQTVAAAPTLPPVPTAAPSSHAAAAPLPVRSPAVAAARTSKPSSSLRPWLVGIGALIVGFGLSTLFRGRRTPRSKTAAA